MSKKEIAEYRAWMGMKARCYSPVNKDHGTYQKNGVSVCDEWINSFDQFFLDMGERPSPLHSLDRKDNSKGYTKDNCKWSTKSEQAKNRGSFTPLYSHNGEERILKDWAKEFGINYTTLRHRVLIKGLSLGDAVRADPFCRKLSSRAPHQEYHYSTNNQHQGK